MGTRQGLSGRRRVFEVMRSGLLLSRAELAQRCGLTRPAVSSIVEELLQAGLVTEAGRGNSSGGKPPILLSLVPESRCAIGLELGDEHRIRAVLCDLGCRVLKTADAAYENRFDDILEVSIRLVRELASGAPLPPLGIGCAVSGVVSPGANEVIRSATMDIAQKGFAEKLRSATQLAVTLERRPDAAALAESLFGAGRCFRSLIFLTTGRGTGAGVLLEGLIYRGSHGTAGELGALSLPSGELLEEAVRPGALAKALGRIRGENVNFSEFWRCFRAGDKDAAELVRAQAAKLALGARAAADLLDPEAIILGGQALEFGDLYFDAFQEAFYGTGTGVRAERQVQLRRSRFGSEGGAIGGAQVVLDQTVR